MKSYFVKLAALTSVMVVIAAIIYQYLASWYHALMPHTLVYSAALTGILHAFALSWGKNATKPKTNNLLAALVFHFIFFLLFYVICLFSVVGYDLKFTAWFLLCFIIFSLFEFLTLLTILQPQK